MRLWFRVILVGMLIFTITAFIGQPSVPSVPWGTPPRVTETALAEAQPAAELEQATVDAAARAQPSVVKIESERGLGSGVIIDPRGYIVTNYHVLFGERATSPAANYTVTLANGTPYRATITGTAARDDLAVLKINATGLRALPVADSGKLRVGQFMLAVGNPFGYSQTVTMGIVSTLRRTIAEQGLSTFIPDMIQTSAPINPGNSGGALVDLQGRLVGIPSLAATDPRVGTAAQGIGFAVPSNRVSFLTKQIIEHGKVVHSGRAYLGVAGLTEVTPGVAARYGLHAEHGVLIREVVRGGPMDRGGVRAGDVIVRLAERPTPNEAALADALVAMWPGRQVAVTIDRDGQERTVTVTLGELPLDQ